LHLTPDQLAAARARGCVVTPATAAQVQRLSMQRRIFHVGGEPFVAARDGFFETHGTLSLLVEGHGRGGAPGKPETVQEAAAADAASEREMAGERRAGGAQEVRRRGAWVRPNTRRG
jgi:hypothetical protein